jgi:hypothetical protein
MSTTLLFVELLIAGTQVSVWLALLLVTLFGYSWIPLQRVADWQNIMLVLFLTFSYTLGVVFDRLADSVFEPWNRHLKDKFIPNPPLPIVVMRFEVGKDNKYLNNQFEYTRSRMRIARASAINAVLIAIIGTAFALVRVDGTTSGQKTGLCAATLAVGMCIASLCAFAWRNMMRTYLELVKVNYERLALE